MSSTPSMLMQEARSTQNHRTGESQHPPILGRLGSILAGFLVLAGLAGLVGRATGLQWLSAPFTSWPASRLFTSIALIGLGLALLGFVRSNLRLSRWASAAPIGIGIASLLSYVHPLPLPGGGMSLVSAIMITTAALGLLLASREGPPDAYVPHLGVAGFLLLALSTTLVVARVAGVIDPMTDPAVAGVSLQAVLGSFFLGACFLGFIWSRRIGAIESAGWLAAAFGIASLITVITLWRMLSAREADQVLVQTSQAAESRRRALTRDLDVSARSLHRAAEWVVRGALPEQRELDIQALKRDLPGLEEGFWISASDVPSAHDPGPLSTVAGLDSTWHDYLRRMGGLPDTIAYLPLDHAAQRFAILAPGCQELRCSGVMVGMMRSALLFQRAFSDSTRGFQFGIAGPAGPLEGSPAPESAGSRWVQELPLEFGAISLKLTAWPTNSTLGRIHSNLPDLVLVLGLVVSGLLPLTIRLGQSAHRGARELERARLASALERATDGIWEWDLVSDAMVISSGIWRYLGYDPEVILPTRMAWTALIHPEDHASVGQALKQYLRGEAACFEAEYRVRSKNGDWHTIVDRGRVVDRTPTGQPARILGISADVTEARSAQEARENTERRFRAVFDSGFQFQLLLDHDGTVLEVNRITLQEGGTPAEVVRGKPVWDTLWWARDAGAQERLRVAVAAAFGGATPRYEDEIRAEDGATTILEIAVKTFLDGAGQPNQFLLEARDITVRRRAEAALQEVDTLTTMGRVAAQVAHEINNPLAGIQNAFLLIKGAVPPSHPHYAYVGAIEREIGRIAKVTRQLYETYRPEQETTGETSIRTMLGDAVAFLEQVNRAAGVKVETDLRRVPIVISLPPAILRQIAYNLVQNAIEASPPGTTVRVGAEMRGSRLELRVRDHGPGIPPELRERIFESFFSTKDRRFRSSGMGLGLALVRRTVAAAGGVISVDDAPDGGSEFVVTLPLNAPENGG